MSTSGPKLVEESFASLSAPAPVPAPRKLSLADFQTRETEEFHVGSPEGAHDERRKGFEFMYQQKRRQRAPSSSTGIKPEVESTGSPQVAETLGAKKTFSAKK